MIPPEMFEPNAFPGKFTTPGQGELPSRLVGRRHMMQRREVAGHSPRTSIEAAEQATDTSTQTSQTAQSDVAGTARLEALSDGAFAIITLLVLEIHRPGAAPGMLAEELLKEWPSYLAYAVAFLYVGVIWLNHQYMFDASAKWTSP